MCGFTISLEQLNYLPNIRFHKSCHVCLPAGVHIHAMIHVGQESTCSQWSRKMKKDNTLVSPIGPDPIIIHIYYWAGDQVGRARSHYGTARSTSFERLCLPVKPFPHLRAGGWSLSPRVRWICSAENSVTGRNCMIMYSISRWCGRHYTIHIW